MIIIARYNENLDWVNNLKHPYIIINKGDEISFPSIKIDNVARESYSYLYYIVNNYDNLDDYLVFLQGNPFDHSPNALGKIEGYFNNGQSNFYTLSDRIVEFTLNGCQYHPGLPLIKSYNLIFNDTMDNDKIITFGAGAQFIVPKENILKHPKDFYVKLFSLVEKDSILEWVCERFWGLIFNEI